MVALAGAGARGDRERRDVLAADIVSIVTDVGYARAVADATRSFTGSPRR